MQDKDGNDIESNWRSMKLVYDDYALDQSRFDVLAKLTEEFIESLNADTRQYIDDPLSNVEAVHVTGTEEQSRCFKWFQKRFLLITASIFKEFCTNPRVLLARLWNQEADLSRIKAIQWGIENEDTAIEAFEAKISARAGRKMETKKCGLFIHKALPYFAVSPDRLFQDYLIEVKCPYTLRNVGPNDLHTLEHPENHFRKKNCNCDATCLHEARLKRSHKYFAQCQLQMFVTGYKQTIFLTQTPKDFATQIIEYEHDFTWDLILKADLKYKTVFIPEYFEQRWPRELPLIEFEVDEDDYM